MANEKTVTVTLSLEQAGLLECALNDYAGILQARVAADLLSPTGKTFCREAADQPRQVHGIARLVGDALAAHHQADADAWDAVVKNAAVGDVLAMAEGGYQVRLSGAKNPNCDRIWFDTKEKAETFAADLKRGLSEREAANRVDVGCEHPPDLSTERGTEDDVAMVEDVLDILSDLGFTAIDSEDDGEHTRRLSFADVEAALTKAWLAGRGVGTNL